MLKKIYQELVFIRKELQDSYGYPGLCAVYRTYGNSLCGIHAVHTADNFMVYDSSCYSGGIISSLCGNVWLGKGKRTLEKIL